jgi:benzoyl-CoA 2,3-dioxygenase component A
MKLPESLLHRELVFSRESGEHKEYVQDRMLACAERVAELMQSEQTHVFICGLKGMEEGVDASLQQICSDAGMDWPALRQDMLQQGRYHVETY